MVQNLRQSYDGSKNHGKGGITMRKLEECELRFWNSVSIGILIDAGFVLDLSNGLIVGIGTEGE